MQMVFRHVHMLQYIHGIFLQIVLLRYNFRMNECIFLLNHIDTLFSSYDVFRLIEFHSVSSSSLRCVVCQTYYFFHLSLHRSVSSSSHQYEIFHN
ncbi:hypothetical protein NY2A_b392L [Paramecium bursaria Chlorella virus NY2A]|uniref:Uncharacterized protein b392L n=1 Tax=Paramecium bursaria Chlorella virus NY2A TaxID=46021 RepID=A7IWR7_PBCVN|nr:hypothetical protein NY2A_b392L [Paramecium bursaria Chlorella virus NY2A]ABT14791.1 hypothetical protein NY2A_b392L [Paramecium bursaria Chlorella virus NY2A]